MDGVIVCTQTGRVECLMKGLIEYGGVHRIVETSVTGTDEPEIHIVLLLILRVHGGESVLDTIAYMC